MRFSTPVILISVLLLSLSVVMGGWFIGHGFEAGRARINTVSVKGLAEKEVKADMAIWPIKFVVSGNDLNAVQAKIEKDNQIVQDFLKAEGIAQDAIQLSGLDVIDLMSREYRPNNIDNRFILSQNVMVMTSEVDKVQEAAQNVKKIVQQGVILASDNPSYNTPTYVFTNLNELKPAMLQEATARAREGAQQFANDSGSYLGGITRAYQGIFQILPAADTRALSEDQQVMKKIRVVSTIDYEIID